MPHQQAKPHTNMYNKLLTTNQSTCIDLSLMETRLTPVIATVNDGNMIDTCYNNYE